MKTLILTALFAFPTFASAAEFQGTMVLKGSLKSKVFVNGVETTCRADVKKVRNILEEDAFGNPGYTVKLKVNLDGRDSKRKIEVKSEVEGVLTNFHKDGDKIVAKDLLYADSESGLVMTIDYEGRIKSVVTTVKGQKVTCLF